MKSAVLQILRDRWNRLSPQTRTLAVLSAASVLLSIQALVVFIVISNNIPLKSSLMPTVFPEWRHLVRPERDMVLFRFFVGAVIVLQAGGVFIFRRRLADNEFLGKLATFVCFETVMTFLLLSALFKSIVYDYHPDMAHRALVTLLAVAVISKIVWPWLSNFAARLYGFWTDDRHRTSLDKVVGVIFPLLIIAIIYIPYPQAVMMRSFVGEQFHHNDSYIMGPGWAFLKGCALDFDVITQYGLGMPVVLSMAAKIFFGAFSYENIFLVLMWACILYYLAVYWLLRRWLGNPWLVMTAVLLGIKWQMFHTGVFPIVYTYGSATVTRYYFDIFFLIFIFFHIKNSHKGWLAAAAVTAGLAVFYISSDGLYLAATFYAYLLIHAVVPMFREKIIARKVDWLWLSGLALLMPLTTFLGLWWLEGPRLFSTEFWHNMGEFIQYFLSGFGVTPMTESVKYRYFLASLMGFIMPLGYVLTMIVAGSLIYLRKWDYERLFVIVLCIYGLGIFHYYVARSAVTSYDAVCLPFVYILAFWIQRWTERLPARRAHAVITIVFLTAAYALLTNHNFMSYPNHLNFSRNPMTDPLVAQRLPTGLSYFNHLFVETPQELKLPVNSLGETDEKLYFEKDFNSDDMLVSYYGHESDFAADARMIARLTRADARVAVISSFEIKILMQADRAPFFYYFPLVISRPMHMRMFPVTSMYTVDHFKKTIGQLERAKPEYIFMERIFLQRNVPQAYYDNDPALMGLLGYVFEHYTPSETGQFLVAMKRKEAS